MARGPQEQLSNTTNCGDIGNLALAADLRRRATWELSMSERLAEVHRLSKQMSAVKGAAQAR
jgi:hypothetical protein